MSRNRRGTLSRTIPLRSRIRRRGNVEPISKRQRPGNLDVYGEGDGGDDGDGGDCDYSDCDGGGIQTPPLKKPCHPFLELTEDGQALETGAEDEGSSRDEGERFFGPKNGSVTRPVGDPAASEQVPSTTAPEGVIIAATTTVTTIPTVATAANATATTFATVGTTATMEAAAIPSPTATVSPFGSSDPPTDEEIIEAIRARGVQLEAAWREIESLRKDAIALNDQLKERTLCHEQEIGNVVSRYESREKQREAHFAEAKEQWLKESRRARETINSILDEQERKIGSLNVVLAIPLPPSVAAADGDGFFLGRDGRDETRSERWEEVRRAQHRCLRGSSHCVLPHFLWCSARVAIFSFPPR